MTALAARTRPASPALQHPGAVDPLGRLGRWTADHVRAVALAAIMLGTSAVGFCPLYALLHLNTRGRTPLPH